MTPSGALTTLFNFPQGSLNGTLVQALNGDFYGATFYDVSNCTACGTVFKMTPSGGLTTLYNSRDGFATALIQATNGNLYGGTVPRSDSGTIFEVTSSGTLATLYSFTDGEYPSGLVQDTNGTFYGTTPDTIFSFSVGLGPFVKTQTTSGQVGAAINILGSDLTGTTSVTFNGTPATFTVVSTSLVTTTVPADATSGRVQVITPGGTLSSNVPYRVGP
jgi:hypothetical protein